MLSFRLKQYAKMAAQQLFLPVCYRIFCLRPVRKGTVVFADAHHDSRPVSMDTLYYALKRSGKCRVTEIYLDYQNTSFRKLLAGMVRFMKLYAHSEYVVICDNFLPAASCRKRKGTKVIQLWHACGSLKRFGYDAADDIPSSFKGHVFRNTDLVTVSSPACVQAFAGAMKLPEENVKPTGVCRTDAFYSENWIRRRRDAFYAMYPDAVGKKIAVWAPTFRGNAAEGKSIRLDLDELESKLGREWKVLACLHPHMKAKEEDADHLCPLPCQDLFPVTDVLIADYSSLIFEYMLFDRSLILYSPDLDEYSEKRGFYLDYGEIPAIHVSREQDLPLKITMAGPGPDEQMRLRRERFLEKYMSSCDGRAAKRIRFLIEEGELPPW